MLQTSVRALAATPDNTYILSAANGDRSIAIFSLAVKPSTKPKVRKAKGHLPVEDPPVSLGCCSTEDSPDSCVDAFQALAVTEVGEAYVWLCRKEDGAIKGTIRARIRIGSAALAQRGLPSSMQHCVIHAAFEGADGAASDLDQ